MPKFSVTGVKIERTLCTYTIEAETPEDARYWVTEGNGDFVAGDDDTLESDWEYDRGFDVRPIHEDGRAGDLIPLPDEPSEIETAPEDTARAGLVLALKCCLADLEGIMPEFEPSGDRTHSGWQSIQDARTAIFNETWDADYAPRTATK